MPNAEQVVELAELTAPEWLECAVDGDFVANPVTGELLQITPDVLVEMAANFVPEDIVDVREDPNHLAGNLKAAADPWRHRAVGYAKAVRTRVENGRTYLDLAVAWTPEGAKIRAGRFYAGRSIEALPTRSAPDAEPRWKLTGLALTNNPVVTGLAAARSITPRGPIMLSRFIAAQIMAAGLTLADAAAQLGVPEDKLAAGELDDAQQDALSALLANGIAAKAAAPAMEEAQAAKSALAAAKTVGSVAERTSLELTQRIDALEKRTKTLQERHVTSLKLAAVRDGCITPAEVDTDGAFGYLLGQVADQDYETGLRPLLASTRAYKPGTISTGPARPIGSLPGERGTEQMDRIEAGRRLGEHLVADAALERPVYNRSLSALVANPPPNLIEAARIYAGQES